MQCRSSYRHLLSRQKRHFFYFNLSMSKSSLASATTTTAAESRLSPVAGVLCTDISTEIKDVHGADLHSYIAASYVKFLESAGARVVPIWIGRERGYYEQIMSKVNGILIPGGAVYISDEESAVNTPIPTNLTNDCVLSTKHIYDIATAKNALGNYFPLWGTCLGFQLMLIHAANNENLRQPCSPISRAMHLRLVKDFRESHLFKNLPEHYEQPLRTEAFAIHSNRYCITEENMCKLMRRDDWHVLATNCDDNGLEFVTLIEHVCYPYFGSQFHPERVPHEHLAPAEDKIKNARQCIELVQYFGHTFVDACRRSTNSFASVAEEQRHLIWNFPSTFTGRNEKIRWLVSYLFTRDADYPKS